MGFGWPIVALWFQGELPVGVLGGVAEWTRASDLLANWQIMPKPMIFGVEFSVTLATALGVAALAPILAPAVTTANFAAARRSGILWRLERMLTSVPPHFHTSPRWCGLSSIGFQHR